MRILSAFFAVLFIFINPCMLYKVITETEASLDPRVPERMRPALLQSICAYVISNSLTSKLRLGVYVTVLVFALLHFILTGLSLYGHYACRPAFIRPFLFDIVFSFFLLLVFVSFSVFMYYHVSSNAFAEEKEYVKTQLRNIYVGTAFLVVYLVWLTVSVAAFVDTKKLHADFMCWIVEEKSNMRILILNVYVGTAFLVAYVVWFVASVAAFVDTRKLHADFMYWIVEEKNSMRSKANASSDIRSERSSKASKTSRTSTRSVKSDRPQLFSQASEITCKRMPCVDARLSVPL